MNNWKKQDLYCNHKNDGNQKDTQQMFIRLLNTSNPVWIALKEIHFASQTRKIAIWFQGWRSIFCLLHKGCSADKSIENRRKVWYTVCKIQAGGWSYYSNSVYFHGSTAMTFTMRREILYMRSRGNCHGGIVWKYLTAAGMNLERCRRRYSPYCRNLRYISGTGTSGA